jgi:hypothetical protein
MSKKIEPILVTRQKTVILTIIKLIVTQGVHVAIKAKYYEPIFNQHSGNIVRVSRDWSRGIYSVNRVSRLNFQ